MTEAVEDPGLAKAYESVLRDDGLAAADLKARSVERAWLARARRALWVRPAALAVSGEGPDDKDPARRKVTVSFTLPPGSYATLELRAAGAV